MSYKSRSVMSAVVAMSATVVLFGQTATTTPTTAGVSLAANTLLVMGGNSNPNGVDMNKELNGYISGNPNTAYAGYTFKIVPWSAQTPFSTGSDGTLFDASQTEGLGKIDAALATNYTSGSKLVVVGYSSSASVVTKQIRELQAKRGTVAGAASTPSTADLSFIVFGNPNRPNGGFFARYPGLKLGPPLGVTSDGATPPSDYKVTDISWQYDGFADYPVDPTNKLAVANAVIGFFTLHGNYFNADITDKSKILTDVTVGNTRYITLKSQLPLLSALYSLGIPSFILAPVDAALRVQIEKGYNRTVSPGVVTPAVGDPNSDPLLSVLRLFFGGTATPGLTPPVPTTTTKTLTTLAAVTTAPSTTTATSIPATVSSTTTSTSPVSTTTSAPASSVPTTTSTPSTTTSTATTSTTSTVPTTTTTTTTSPAPTTTKPTTSAVVVSKTPTLAPAA